MMKFYRLIIYLTTFKQIGLTFEVFFQLIPFLKSFLGMLLIIFFIFATIGGNLFGGRISNKTPSLYKEKTNMDLPTNYFYINFNDLPSSILALYVNVINNNWIYFTNMFILDEEDKRTHLRWYFVIFQLITNLFVMTILIGFIIDNILKQFEKMIEEEKKKHKEEDEEIPLLEQERRRGGEEGGEGEESDEEGNMRPQGFDEEEENTGNGRVFLEDRLNGVQDNKDGSSEESDDSSLEDGDHDKSGLVIDDLARKVAQEEEEGEEKEKKEE